MGTVYQAAHHETGALAALKLMKPDVVASPELRKRFRQEAVICARVESDHIVRVYDAGTDEATGVPFIVMGLLRGGDLEARLAARGPYAVPQVVLLLHQVALALERTHAAGVVHRDLKPSNLLVTQRDDGGPCVKIVDFGIAKIIAQSGSLRTTLAAGTPFYMAPEQIRGDATIGPAADRFALGHLAYTLLVGEEYWRPLYESEGGKVFPVLRAIQTGPVRLATESALARGVRLPPTFDRWFRIATAVDPAARFDGAYAQIQALADALGAPRPRPLAPWW